MSQVRVEGGSLSYSHREKRRFRFGKDWWVVDSEYHLHSAEGHLVIPTGFLTDGASVPRAFWGLLQPMSEYTAIAVIHDFFYRHKGVVKWQSHTLGGTTIEVTRRRADVIFRDGMIFLNVAKWKVPVMYQAVRKFGPRW